jgi:hypothetical protein
MRPNRPLTDGGPGLFVILVALATAALALLVFAPTAGAASKQAVDFFGGDGALGGQFTQPNGVAVNDSGAGPADAGDVYAIDSRCCGGQGSANRIQRFGRDDNGTPADTADDTYFFISAWGADVDATPAAGSDYEICTVAAECQAAVASGGNGTPAGNGALDLSDFNAGEIAVDQDTGNLYVSDPGNNRVNVYDGTGTFLRSFGFDVAASGPGNTGTGLEVCVAADGDVCKAGVSGANVGQVGNGEGIAISAPDVNPATGTVFLADSANNRVNTYNLDGTSPGSLGSAAVFAGGFPTQVAIDSRGILYASNQIDGGLGGGTDSRILRYDTANANGGGVGFLAPILAPYNENQRLNRNATAGQFRLRFGADTTADLSFNATREQVRAALEALPSIGAGNVTVGDCFCAEAFFPIRFTGALAATDVAELVASNGTTPLTGTISVTTIIDGHGGALDQNETTGLAVDPDTDGPGADTDVLYAARGSAIQQFGPLNPPGLSAPPSAEDDRHGTSGAAGFPRGIAVEPTTGRLYTASSGEAGRGVYVIDDTGPPPTASLDSCDNVTATSAECHATIDPNGPPATRYHFEYSTDGSRWLGLPEVLLGAQTDPQAIDRTIDPAPIGLQPNTLYHVRVIAGRKFATPITTNELTFTIDPSPPLAETAGAPVRTTTTAQINGRVTPLGSATTYHFEYGTDQTYGQSTPSMPAGSGQLTELAGEEITGLSPDTTYHYRLVADNGVGSPVPGADMTVHTRASDTLAGQSDTFPGPPGSDRAWEMVSLAESSGNPISAFFPDAFSDDGNRALYGIAGGTPISPTGSLLSLYFSQRTPRGWQTTSITPPRGQLVGSLWFGPWAADDLSSLIARNGGTDSGVDEAEIWGLAPGSSPTMLVQRSASENFGEAGLSADGSRAAAIISGAPDPAFPAASAFNAYDVSSGAPQLLSLLPGELVGPCGADGSVVSESNWISEDGSLAYFQADPAAPCDGNSDFFHLYVRDLLAGQTRLISGPPLSGPDCGGALVKATPGAAFFATSNRLDLGDPTDCGGAGANDVYRYDTGDGSLQCVTCATPGFGAGVNGSGPAAIAVAEDGSRVYFTTTRRLLPGAPPDGTSAVYRADVASGDLAYVAPRNQVGTALASVDLSADGTTLAFSSDQPFFNPLGVVSDNDGATQYYRYEDTGRSLVCVSCPTDGSAPTAPVSGDLHKVVQASQNNARPLSADGGVLAFSTPTPLLGADQNTPGPGQDPDSGTDIYEWREGRHLLVTDGLTSWAENEQQGAVSAPFLEGVSPSGNDVFFAATAAYTPDAPDALYRLYTARIGGGIEFPAPPPPCPLEVCQGTPRGAPDDPLPGTTDFAGHGNLSEPAPNGRRTCPKGKRKVRRAGVVRCVPKKRKRAGSHRRANRDRRAAR